MAMLTKVYRAPAKGDILRNLLFGSKLMIVTEVHGGGKLSIQSFGHTKNGTFYPAQRVHKRDAQGCEHGYVKVTTVRNGRNHFGHYIVVQPSEEFYDQLLGLEVQPCA